MNYWDTKNKTFSIYTLGCKANNYDSECIKTSFIATNYQYKKFNEICDVYIINTCAVTNRSVAKSRKIIRQTIKRNSNAIIVIVGCYSQIESKQIRKEFPEVNIILGTENKYKIVDIIEKHKNIKDQYFENITSIMLKNDHEKNITIKKFINQTRAFVKIQDGCDNFCTFCIIPYTRGKLRSRNSKDIIQEIQNLVNNGHKEVVLTGIHTAGYGEDFKNYNFYDLLVNIKNNVNNLKRLRISSIEISQISKEIKELLIQNKDFFVPHLHIPLQAGSDNILVKMERKYNLKQYYDIVNTLKQEINDIAITTDIIIGFPGETQEDFNKCVEFCKNIEFSEIHVFPYAPKLNTPAANMKQVNEFIKKMRVQEMLNLNKDLALNYINKNKNKILHVLFENKNKNNKYVGYSENYIKIEVNSDINIQNLILPIKLTKINYPISEGKIIWDYEEKGKEEKI